MLTNIPRHVGVIMDGNGRWAKLRGLPRVEGHRKGAERTKELIKAAQEVGIDVLTLYAFSLENWQRPDDEVTTLMELLQLYLTRELKDLIMEGIRFRVIGDREKLPAVIQGIITEIEERTSANEGLTLVIALSYGGRDEILRAVKKAITGGVRPEEISEERFETLLDTSGLPAVDLIIRTSGEKRLSNFLLWQGAYAEFYFTETLWPDFTREEFLCAIQDYQHRERRFGGIMSPSES
ncbi:Undecaprenyl diphosphate synthase [hydrothermal vent metagenome]|uniref:Undecaprenyl diphosphate synthase n=1 Tax=hydrothermal vent metagenome TaxID=652676 RepID=A0A3B1DHC3_9ZZZZ